MTLRRLKGSKKPTHEEGTESEYSAGAQHGVQAAGLCLNKKEAH